MSKCAYNKFSDVENYTSTVMSVCILTALNIREAPIDQPLIGKFLGKNMQS